MSLFHRSRSALFVAVTLLAAAAVLPGPGAQAQGAGLPDMEDPLVRLGLLGKTVQQQIKTGPHNEAEFGQYLEQLAKLKGQFEDPKGKEVMQILLLSLQINLDIFEDCSAAANNAREFERKFSDSENGPLLISIWDQVAKCELKDTARQDLVGKPAPDIEFSWSSDKSLKSLSQLKGKVVVLDFWSNTSQPSVTMFSTMRRLEDRFTGLDVEIVGVTHPVGTITGLRKRPMDFRGKPTKELKTLAKYRKVKNINWILAANEKPTFVREYVVTRYPTMVIIDPDGIIRHANIRDDVAYLTRAEMIDRLLKEFGKPTSGLVR